MKKIILFMVLALIPFGVKAETFVPYYSCSTTTIKSGDTITCSFGTTVSGFEAATGTVTISVSSNLVVESFSSSGLSTSFRNNTVVVNDPLGQGNISWGTFRIKVGNVVSGTESISFSNISTANDTANTTVWENNQTVSLRVKSSVNSLANLTVSGTSFTFNENTTTYNLTVDAPSTVITATKRDNYSSVVGAGSKTLNYGNNTFNIVVTSETGVQKTYTININRPDNRSTVNTLSSLSLSEGKINFNKNTTNYNLTVDNKISSIKVSASLSDSKSSFVSGYGPRTVSLVEGTNNIEIRVQAENQSIKTYVIKVTRKASEKKEEEKKQEQKNEKSNNNYLKELSISDGTLVFNKDTLEYKVTVLYEVADIEIKATAEDNKSKVEGVGEKSLNVGENTIIVKVTAEDNSTKEYKIIVTRKEEGKVLSSNGKLSKLIIDGYEFDFSSDIYQYNLKIKDEDTLDISYVTEDSKASATVLGNENLEDGSIITVSVVAEDGSIVEYEINIEKSNTKNILIISSIIALSLIAIILIICLIVKKRKNKTI